MLTARVACELSSISAFHGHFWFAKQFNVVQRKFLYERLVVNVTTAAEILGIIFTIIKGLYLIFVNLNATVGTAESLLYLRREKKILLNNFIDSK